VADWSFLTSHARVLPCFARDPGVRLRDTAARTGVSERTGYGIVTDLTEAGYVVKHKDGRRNRYQIQAHLPLPAGSGTRPRSRRWRRPAGCQHARRRTRTW
jgi:DNA-binding IclR family transcriptional regulator